MLISLGLGSCQEPSPLELKDDSSGGDDKVEVEALQSVSEGVVYSSGYDSTGVVSSYSDASSIITVSAIKTTFKGRTARAALAQAVFRDKTQPVRLPNGTLIGYRTHAPGVVSFDNVPARLSDLKVKFRYHSVLMDTLLGKYYLLYKKEGRGDAFDFLFDSRMNFRLRLPGGEAVQTEIQTPSEISADVVASGSQEKHDLAFTLKWNAPAIRGEKIDIVIGGVRKGREESSALYRISTSDDGSLVLPGYLLSSFPFSLHEKLVFTFIRRKILENSSGQLNDSYILAQSIHNVQYKIP